MTRAVVSVVSALVAMSCGGATTSTGEQRPGDGGAEAAADAEASYTMINGAKCCAEGTGTECCSSDEPPWKCAPYGGPTGHCSRAGEAYATKVACAQCCAGMRPIGLSEVGADGACTIRPSDSRVCAPCGDSVCDPAAGENHCSCPMDCP
jgi:hypothetical protein